MAGEIITGYNPNTTQGADQLAHSGSSKASRRRHRVPGALFAAGLALAGVVAAAPASHAEEAHNDVATTLSLPGHTPRQINNVCHVSVGTEGQPVGKRPAVSYTNRGRAPVTAVFSQNVDFRNEFSVLFGIHNPVTYKDAIRVAPGQKVVTIFYTDRARTNITDPRGSCTTGKFSIVRK